jgi:hypothetical protein
MKPVTIFVLSILLLPMLGSGASEPAAGPEQARQQICDVLTNIFYMLAYIGIGVGIVVWGLILACTAIVFVFKKGDESRFAKLFGRIAVAAVFGWPVVVLLGIGALYVVKWIFTGGKC